MHKEVPGAPGIDGNRQRERQRRRAMEQRRGGVEGGSVDAAADYETIKRAICNDSASYMKQLSELFEAIKRAI